MQRKQTLSLLWMGVGTGTATVNKEKQSHGKTMEASWSSLCRAVLVLMVPL